MPKVLDADGVYEAADRYRVACIRDSRSLLWPSDKVWTLANLTAARESLKGPKGEGGDSFLEHWRQRLAPLAVGINQVGVDLLALYYIFVDMSVEAKLAKIATAVGWKLADHPPDQGFLARMLSGRTGFFSTYYLGSQNRQMEYLCVFAIESRPSPAQLFDSKSTRVIANKAAALVPGSREARNILLHLLHPSTFEAIALDSHKQQIVEGFPDLVKDGADQDEAIDEIRQGLSRRMGRENLSFYDKDVESVWRPKTSKSWIFQNNPATWDLRAAVQGLKEIAWSTSQHASEIAPGDHVYMWEAGSEAGIQAIGEVLDRPARRPETPAEARYRKKEDPSGETEKVRARVSVDSLADPPLLRREIMSIPELATLSILKFPQGTNFPVTPKEANVLERLLRDRLIQPQSASGRRSIAGALEEVLGQYCEARQSATFSGDHPVFAALQRLAQSLAASQPIRSNPHLKVKPSAGQGNWAKVPWVAIMDDRETTSTQKGIYCVYLFREDCSGVYMTLNQGVVEPQRLHRAAEGKRLLRERAAELRNGARSLGGSGFQLDEDIDLRSTAGLGADYEASTVAYKLYEKGDIPDDEVLLKDLTQVLGAYESVLSPPTPPATLDSVLAGFSQSLSTTGLRFGTRHDETVRSFLASVITKPLVILTGLSGSGKTQIAIKFGEWLGQEHLLVIPVRPDWTGPEALFGYVDVLRPSGPDGSRPWSVPNALAFMLKAARDPINPYVLVLDEMNLAHVERYFADYLSGMESAQLILPNLVEESGEWHESPDDRGLPIPRNLFIVGTVNVDETTYMFSPKVLDRANTLEFRVATDDLAPIPAKPTVVAAASRTLTQALLAASTDDSWQESHPTPHLSEFVSHVKILHRVLSKVGAEFGYRTYYEARRFASVYYALGGTEWQNALDLQVMQKVLPKLHGSRRRLEPTLSALARFCFDLGAVDDQTTQFDPVAATTVDPRLPISFEKIRRMTLSLRANQFVSFTE